MLVAAWGIGMDLLFPCVCVRHLDRLSTMGALSSRFLGGRRRPARNGQYKCNPRDVVEEVPN